MNQSTKPDAIILWLAEHEWKGTNAKISDFNRLQARGLDIRIREKNLRSYTKLFHAIEEFKDDAIITIDDDIMYPTYFIEDLCRRSRECPEAVVGYSCAFMKKLHVKKMYPYASWRGPENNQPSFNLFARGVAGVLYPPGCLHDTVLDDELFLRLVPTGDDIWFKAMALMNETKTVSVYEQNKDFPAIPGYQDRALWKINEDVIDKQIKTVFDYFKLYGLIE